MKTTLQHQIESLEKENTSLKRKIETIDNQHRNVAVNMEVGIVAEKEYKIDIKFDEQLHNMNIRIEVQ